jgi:hypothetical protein
MSALLVGGAVLASLLACESPEERRTKVAAESRTRIAAESARASAAVTVPSTGTWNDAVLVKHLVDAGLAPQRRDSVRGQDWMGAPVLAYRLGAATVDVYLYRDSLARRAVVARLDPLAFAPRGQPSPWGTPRDVVENGNLVAIVVGGTDRQRDRIATALAAGPGAP